MPIVGKKRQEAILWKIPFLLAGNKSVKTEPGTMADAGFQLWKGINYKQKSVYRADSLKFCLFNFDVVVRNQTSNLIIPLKWQERLLTKVAKEIVTKKIKV